MVKRKAECDAAIKNNKTPIKNLANSEFATEYSSGEETAKHANRNSKKGRAGKNNG